MHRSSSPEGTTGCRPDSWRRVADLGGFGARVLGQLNNNNDKNNSTRNNTNHDNNNNNTVKP